MTCATSLGSMMDRNVDRGRACGGGGGAGFQSFYGDAQGLNMWENAGAQEPGVTAGAHEPGVAAPGPGAPEAAARQSPATDAPAGAAEPGRDAIVQVLFRPADMDFFRAEGARYGPGELHNAARRGSAGDRTSASIQILTNMP